RAQRGFPDIAVMFIDLDDFKTVNDSLGHAAGDRVLQEVARRLLIAVRPTDTVARFGGDEFAVLVEGVSDSPEAADAAARILQALEIPTEIESKQVFPRASIGICLVDREIAVPDAAELLRNADVALYTACLEGVRIQNEFPRAEPLTMSVNLSVRQLQSDSIVADVSCALEQSGLDPSALVLEITESVMMADTDFAVQRLMDLKALGIRLAMDDFGTGYSSLSYLSRFPVDILKMDRSFVGSGENVALTSAIIALGAS